MSFLSKKKSILPPNYCLTLSECLAKTYSDDDNTHFYGRDVFTHCLIVGHIARSLLSRMPQWLTDSLYPCGCELVASVHDVGKVSPTFQEKIRRGKNNSSDYIPNSYRGLEGINPDDEEQWGGHAGVSQLAVKACLPGKYIPEIVGQHHGFSPPVAALRAESDCFGGNLWQQQRELLIERLKLALNVNWPVISDDKQARLLAGLTTVADWIGSGSLFDDPQNRQWGSSVEIALDEAGFVSPKVQKGLSFEEIFHCQPRSIQQELVAACSAPGVYILEAPMGIGKTEAALYAAYKLMEAEKASGLYFALPTQLTSNKIYERVNRFLDKIISTSSPHRKAMLAHAHAKLKMMEMGEEGGPGGSWFSATKRELLAPFGVGTIDQALMSVLNVKHGFVRAFGLAGKVVILDEIHSYDTYTGTMIDALIEHLKAWQCTVIILSATLTAERKKALLQILDKEVQRHYPLISANREGQLVECAIKPESDVPIQLYQCHDDELALNEALLRSQKGQQLLWIENTVQEAQEIYKLLASRGAECGISCGLLHSAFTHQDREQIESYWIDLYGKECGSKRLLQGRILVGTQILEQSLDIDADFLISRICPTDMLLQRLGRLWRHKQITRAPGSEREAWFLSPNLEKAIKDPKSHFGKSACVYSPYYLLRSLELWQPLSGKFLLLPSQMREMIEATYAQREEGAALLAAKRELDEEKAKLQRLALLGLSQAGTTLSDEQVSTRYAEQQTCELLLVEAIKQEKAGVHLTLISGEQLFLPKSGASLKRRRELSLALMRSIVKVAVAKAPPPPSRNEVNWLKDYLYLGNGEMSSLRVARWTLSDELVALDRSSFSQPVNYNKTLGYYVVKNK